MTFFFEYTDKPWQDFLLPAALGALMIAVGVLAFAYNVAVPQGSPRRIKSGNYPIVGAIDFFRKRADFCWQAIRESPTGLYSHTIGMYHIVGISGVEARKKYFESKDLSFTDAYQIMFNASPPANLGEKENPRATDILTDFGSFFNKRLTTMVKRETLKNNLKLLCSDTKARLLDLANDPSGTTDPFESIYRIIFQLTMRTVGCTEIAESSILRERLLSDYQQMEEAAGPMGIIFPWLPTIGSIKRLYSGARVYAMFNKIIAAREAEGRREADPMQFMLDQGDKTIKVITVRAHSQYGMRHFTDYRTCSSLLAHCLLVRSTVASTLHGSSST